MKLTKMILALAVTVVASAMAQAASTKIQDLNWMSGRWVGVFNGLPMEAYYSSSQGGMILGTTKIANGNKAEFFEFERIVEENGSLVLHPYPFGKPGVDFSLKENVPHRVIFENPAHDFPTRIIYELKATGELVGRIEGTQNGQAVSNEFVFSKAQ